MGRLPLEKVLATPLSTLINVCTALTRRSYRKFNCLVPKILICYYIAVEIIGRVNFKLTWPNIFIAAYEQIILMNVVDFADISKLQL